MTNQDEQQHSETPVKLIPWWVNLYGELTGSLKPLRYRLSDEKFHTFEPPSPNAHAESFTYMCELDQIIPHVCGHFRFSGTRPIGEKTVDISEIVAISAGKGIDPFVNDFSGNVYANLDDHAEGACQKEITEAVDAYGMTPEAVEFLLSYYEVRITNEKRGDSLVKIAWNGRIYLSNSGGSHHFSAARYIAKKIGYQRLITGDCYELYANNNDINNFIKDNIILLIEENDIPLTSSKGSIYNLLEKKCRNKHGDITMYHNKLTMQPFIGFAALVFERNNKNEEIADMLIEHGAFDVEEYLVSLTIKQ